MQKHVNNFILAMLFLSSLQAQWKDEINIRVRSDMWTGHVSTMVDLDVVASPNALNWQPVQSAYESIEGEQFPFNSFSSGWHYLPSIEIGYKQAGLMLQINGSGLPIPDGWLFDPEITVQTYYAGWPEADGQSPLVEHSLQYLHSQFSVQILTYFRFNALKIIAGYNRGSQSIYVPNSDSRPGYLLIDGYSKTIRMLLIGLGYERAVTNRIFLNLVILASPEMNTVQYANQYGATREEFMFYYSGQASVDYSLTKNLGLSGGFQYIYSNSRSETLNKQGLSLGIYHIW